MDVKLLKKHKLVSRVLPEGKIVTVTNEMGEKLIAKKIAEKHTADVSIDKLGEKVKAKLEKKEKNPKEGEEDKK